MSIGFLSLGFAVVCGVVCIIGMAYDTIPHEEPHRIQAVTYKSYMPEEL